MYFLGRKTINFIIHSIKVEKVVFEAEKERDKAYGSMTDEFHFESNCVWGVWGIKRRKFIKNLGRRW